ncbi:MAG: DUF6797 domain-containing protein [Balneolaceae bacterium]
MPNKLRFRSAGRRTGFDIEQTPWFFKALYKKTFISEYRRAGSTRPDLNGKSWFGLKFARGIWQTLRRFSDPLHRSFLLSLILGLILLTSACEQKTPVISENNFHEAEIAPFVEPDFPFITTSVDARDLGAAFPDDNITPRCLALQLGNDAYACFDTDLLRWSVGWTGEFLPMVTMAQISYRDFFNKDNQIPEILGQPKIATGLYPGWSGSDPRFRDPRPTPPNPEDPSSGPLPPEMGRWNGIYLNGEDAVLSYTVGNTRIYENPGSIDAGDEVGFTRAFRIDELEGPLTLTVAEMTDGIHSEVSGSSALIYHEGDSVTAVGLVPAGEDNGITLEVIRDRYATVRLAPGAGSRTFKLVIWKGPEDRLGDFEQMLALSGGKTEVRIEGDSPERWPETVRTRGHVAPDTAAYVIDRLTLPLPNPWNRNVRVSDLEFFEDGRAAVVTFEGDVWIVKGIDHSLRNLQWRRYATGLYEPQGIEVVDGEIYVFGKGGITRLRDRSGNGEADFYENFSNLMTQSMETREWATDLAADPDGGFYVAKGGGLNMGPSTGSSAVAPGFRGGSNHSGSIVKVSADGRRINYHATGFRGPYLGIHPETGVLTASDQQGHRVPSTALYRVKEGDYYGVPTTAHRDPVPEITPPLAWIPHNVDRSALGQVWITGGQMGPLNGGLVSLSYGRPGLFSVLIDTTSSAIQGGVSVIPGEYPAPAMKGAVHPVDGQLYVGGFNIWDTNSNGVSALIRLRHTSRPYYLPVSFSVREGGIMLRFATDLEEASVQDLANYQVQRWNYQRTDEYGSGHFRLDGSPGQEHLPVFSARLSDDGKAVWLAVPDMREVQQMEIAYQIKAADGTRFDDAFWLTVNDIEEPDLAAFGFEGLDAEELLSGRPGMAVDQTDEEVSVERGQRLFQQTGCIGCHAVDDAPGTERGPSMVGLFGSERKFEDGASATADEEYLRESILNPGAKNVEGYKEGMPSFQGILPDSQIESILLYIRSLEME